MGSLILYTDEAILTITGHENEALQAVMTLPPNDNVQSLALIVAKYEKLVTSAMVKCERLQNTQDVGETLVAPDAQDTPDEMDSWDDLDTLDTADNPESAVLDMKRDESCRAHTCHICQQTLTSEDSLKRHQKYQHGLSMQADGLPDTTDTSDAQETPDTEDSLDAPDTLDTSNALNLDIPDSTKAPNTLVYCNSGYLDTLDAKSNSDTTDAVDTVDSPEATYSPESKKDSRPKNVIQKFKSPNTSDMTESSDASDTAYNPKPKKVGRPKKVIWRNKRFKSFECYLCKKSFSSSNYLRAHMNAIHIKSESNICKICNKRFTTVSYLKKHVDVIHGGKRQLIKCEICDKSLSNIHTLRRHVDMVHKGIKRHKCEVCDKSFFDVRGLKYHMERKHLVTQESQNTSDTSDTTDSPDALEASDHTYTPKPTRVLEKVHKISVRPSKHLKCDLCIKSFTNSRDFRHHVSLKHPD